MKNNGSLRVRFFTGTFLFVMAWIVVLLSIYYKMAYDQRMNDKSQLFTEKIEGISKQVETIISEMNVVSSQVLASQALQEMLVNASAPKYDSINYFEYNIEERKKAQDVLWSLNSPKKRVYGINVFCKSTYVGLRYSPSAEKIRAIYQSEEWSIPQSEKYAIKKPHIDIWNSEQGVKVISLIREYTATSFGFRNVGIIEVQQDYGVVEEQAFSSEYDMSVLVLDYDGSTVFSNMEFSEEYKQQVLQRAHEGRKEGLYEAEINNVRCMEMLTVIPSTSWIVAISQDRQLFNAPMLRIIGVLILVGSLSAAFVSIGLIILINSITKPVLIFAEDIRKISELNKKPILHETTVREVKILQRSFERLIANLKQSQDMLILANETELNLKILGMQSQINPHFLFNSLNAISAAAQEENKTEGTDDKKAISDKIPIMCYQLGELFRYSSEGEAKVSLRDELDYMKTYLEFMKWRYEDNFSFEMSVIGSTENIEISRMTLQPLVENCFTHAFKQIAPPYKILVNCIADESGWALEVIDNGRGFPQSEVERLSLQIKQIDSILLAQSGYESLQTNNLAILNIYTRLKLQYKNQLSMEITRDAGLSGAKIRIVIKND